MENQNNKLPSTEIMELWNFAHYLVMNFGEYNNPILMDSKYMQDRIYKLLEEYTNEATKHTR